MTSAKARKSDAGDTIMLPQSPIEVMFEVASLLALVTCWAVLIRDWASIPDIAPIHFDISGKPDRVARRRWLFIVPVVALLLYVGLGLVRMMDPQSMNYPVRITPENAERQFAIGRSVMTSLRVVVLLFLAYLSLNMVRVATGKKPGLGVLMLPVFLVVLFATIGLHIVMAYSAR